MAPRFGQGDYIGKGWRGGAWVKDLQDLLKGGPGHPIDIPWGQRPLERGGDMPTLGHRGVQALGGKEGRSGSRELCSHVSQHVSLAHYAARRSEEHTSELQSPLIISYAVFCLKKKFF